MSQMFRTTLRLDLDKPASANAVALLRQLHAERGLSYSVLIVPAVNAYYGKPTVDEGLRETIRSIVREELSAWRSAANAEHSHIFGSSFSHPK